MKVKTRQLRLSQTKNQFQLGLIGWRSQLAVADEGSEIKHFHHKVHFIAAFVGKNESRFLPFVKTKLAEFLAQSVTALTPFFRHIKQNQTPNSVPTFGPLDGQFFKVKLQHSSLAQIG